MNSNLTKAFVVGFLLFGLLAITPAFSQSVKELFDEAAEAFYAGKYDQAVKYYERIIEMEPNFAPAYNALGLALKIQGALNDDVIFYFKKAIELDPSFLPSYDNLGKMYYSIGDMDAAESYFNKGLAIEPDNESMTLSMGWVYLLGRNNSDAALRYFRKVRAKTGAAMAYFGEGICLMSKEKRMEVMEIVTQLRQIDQEGLAQDLEIMLRENRSLIRGSEFPTPSTLKTVNKTQKVSPSVSSSGGPSLQSDQGLSEYDENGELRIRLLDKLPRE